MPLPGGDFYIVERVPPFERSRRDFRWDPLRGGGLLGFYVRLPRLAGRGFSDAKRIIPFRIMNCRFILRRILTAIRGLCRRRQQDSRKGCRLPAFRGVIAISMGYVAKPGTPPLAPIFSLKYRRSENFRVARMTRPVLPAGYVSPPGVAPVKLTTAPCRLRRIQLGSARCRLSPSPAGFEFSRGSDASPRKPPVHHFLEGA